MFVAAGSSDTVTTASRLAYNARYASATMIWVNTEPPATPGDWDRVVIGSAELVLSDVFDDLNT